MSTIERAPKSIQGEIKPKVTHIDEVLVKDDVFEIGKSVRMPVSWDKACRV